MNDIAERLQTTAGIEDMAGRPFTGNQLREAIAEIARLRDELVEAKAARHDADRACALAHAGESAYRNELISANQRIAALERDLIIEIDAGHDTVKRAEITEQRWDELCAKADERAHRAEVEVERLQELVEMLTTAQIVRAVKP